jgi:hypothetical protein
MIVGVNHPLKACQVWEVEKPEYYDTNIPTWKLIYSPDDSMPVDRLFSYYDIVADHGNNRTWDNWTPGTLFQQVRSGKIIEIYEKKVFFTRNGRACNKMVKRYRYVKPSDQLEFSFQYDF